MKEIYIPNEHYKNEIKTKVKGRGGTCFTPVIEFVNRDKYYRDALLIYFTDGYGVYPERMPDYDVIFAFLDEDEHRAPVPNWAMKVIIDSDTY